MTNVHERVDALSATRDLPLRAKQDAATIPARLARLTGAITGATVLPVSL
jgi:hypothetical protein